MNKTYLQKKRDNVLPKIYNLLDDMYYNGKLHGLTVNEVHVLSIIYGDLLFTNQTKFLYSNIAKILEKCGCTVKMDHHKINYIVNLLDS